MNFLASGGWASGAWLQIVLDVGAGVTRVQIVREDRDGRAWRWHRRTVEGVTLHRTKAAALAAR